MDLNTLSGDCTAFKQCNFLPVVWNAGGVFVSQIYWYNMHRE